MRFSLKQLMLIVTLSALFMSGGVLIHALWVRRHVETTVPLLFVAVDALIPHTDWIVADHDAILDIRLDPRTNCAIVTCEYRHRDEAIRAVRELETSPPFAPMHIIDR